jgi:elongation factor 2
MAEKMAEKVARITKDPRFIRNICTSAHIHHGKCISGESRLILEDGSVRTARQIYEDVMVDGAVFEENEDHTVFIPKRAVTVFTLNKASRRIEKKDIQYAWRLSGGKTIKIGLRNGFSIETTPEHKYISFRDGNFIDVEARDFKLGDRIVCARNLKTISNQKIKETLLKLLSKENFYVNLNKEFAGKLKENLLEYGIQRFSQNYGLSIKPKSFYHGIWQNRYNLSDLIKICDAFNIILDEIYSKIDFIFYRTGKQRGQNSVKIKLPEDFEEFFYIAGLFLGDGSGNKFVVGKEELGLRMTKICKSMGINAIRRQWKDKTPEIQTNMTLAYMLKSLFDYPLRKKSHNIRISDFVLNSDNKYVSCLLRGYFDCDGGVERSRSAVTIYSVSNRIVKDLQLLLLRFGCIAIKEKDNSLSISGLSALNFKDNIGFGIKEKTDKLEILVKKISGSIVCDRIRVGNQIMMINKLLKDQCMEDLAFIEVKSIEQGYQDIVYDFTIPDTHNFIAEGMVIHNTAFTDNLLAASGHMAAKNAGDLEEGMATWGHADEQERLLTVDAANVSMVHNYQENEYLINLIDTPGHVDFGGNVTRAMRAIDGTVVLICAVEGIMPQTETVVKQALRERVKPVLFINKCDRLVKELKLTPEKIQERFTKLIGGFNQLIEDIAEPQFKQKWKVNIADGSVAFGSARENWALSLPFMQKKGVGFKDILKIYDMDEETRQKWVWENAALNEVILDMVIKHHPNPIEAQKYRIPKIWKGELESDFGKDLLSCNPQGKLAFVITRIVIDPKSGKDISAGRLFSGTLRPGMDVYLNNLAQNQRIQNLYIYNGVKPELLDFIPAGNVCAISGVLGNAGETITIEPEHPFEALKHIFQPVITKAIEVKKAADLPKLVEVLRKVAREDPSIKIEINEETGENLISGMGELHLEIIENRIITEKGVEVKTSAPIVVFRECITKTSQEVEGKTPNKHNKFYFTVEPLNQEIQRLLKEEIIPEGRLKKKNLEIRQALVDSGMDSKEAEQLKDVYNGNMFFDKTRGQVHIGEVIELILDMFEEVMNKGPLVREPCTGIKVNLMDMTLHEDAIHRGPAQVYPAIREGIRGAMMTASPILLEPLQVMLIEAPVDQMGSVTKLVNSIRGQLLEVNQEGVLVFVKAKLPVMNMLHWSSDLRSATEGRGVSSLVEQSFERMPVELQLKTTAEIKQRKGLTDAMVGV